MHITKFESLKFITSLDVEYQFILNLTSNFWPGMHLVSYNYHDLELLPLIRYGFPLGYLGPQPKSKMVSNHKGAKDFPGAVQKYLKGQMENRKILGSLLVIHLHLRYIFLQLIQWRKRVQ